MPTDNNKSPYKPTGWYAVVHFGSEEKKTLPYFLSKDGCFTANMGNARLYNCIGGAESDVEKMRKTLGEINHPLKDHIKVLQLFGIVRERED